MKNKKYVLVYSCYGSSMVYKTSTLHGVDNLNEAERLTKEWINTVKHKLNIKWVRIEKVHTVISTERIYKVEREVK